MAARRPQLADERIDPGTPPPSLCCTIRRQRYVSVNRPILGGALAFLRGL
jgi:hypothetical protein